MQAVCTNVVTSSSTASPNVFGGPNILSEQQHFVRDAACQSTKCQDMPEVCGACPPGNVCGYNKRMKKKEQHLLDVQSSADKKLARPPTVENSDENQYYRYWMLRLLVTN